MSLSYTKEYTSLRERYILCTLTSQTLNFNQEYYIDFYFFFVYV